MSLIQTIKPDLLQLILEGKICRALDCYQPFTSLELSKKLRICKRHASDKQLIQYHCEGCGIILYDTGRGQQPIRLCSNCTHEAKKLRHREYYQRICDLRSS